MLFPRGLHDPGSRLQGVLLRNWVPEPGRLIHVLEMICQGILTLAVHTVASMLALADQHHCDMLKDSSFSS